ncbi:MAG: peptide-methionine (R)-S-oxide reductase MsrB [Thermoanaerobaculia bacterium]
MRDSTRTISPTLWAATALTILACVGPSGAPKAEAAEKETPMAEQTGQMETRYMKPSDEELRERLTPMQYKVTQEEGTEPAFRNEYWDNHEAGIYVDVVTGEPLFSSLAKFESGTGWPSFWKPLEPDNVVTREDRKLFATRTEVRPSTATPTRPRLRRRPRPHRPALLHELRRPPLRPRRQARGGGLRRVPAAVREGSDADDWRLALARGLQLDAPTDDRRPVLVFG